LRRPRLQRFARDRAIVERERLRSDQLIRFVPFSGD
jgi:hypothetical protein